HKRAGAAERPPRRGVRDRGRGPVLQIAVAGEVHGRRVAGGRAAEAVVAEGVVRAGGPADRARALVRPARRRRAGVAGARAVAGRGGLQLRVRAAGREALGPRDPLAAGAGAVAGAVGAAARGGRGRALVARVGPRVGELARPDAVRRVAGLAGAVAGGVAADAVDAVAARAIAGNGAHGAVRLDRDAGGGDAVVARRA